MSVFDPIVEQHADIPPRQQTRARTWTGETEWYTPSWLLDAAVAVMGGIDLDPASSDAQQAASPVKATRYFTIADNGLTQSWHGRVFLNPPYAARVIDTFVEKFLTERQLGHLQQGILLTNSSTETRWWHAAAQGCDAICFVKGRVRFLKLIDGVLSPGTSSPSHPHSVFYFGDAAAGFASVFKSHGLVVPHFLGRKA
jgi:ParB family chromosome partitioning protein